MITKKTNIVLQTIATHLAESLKKHGGVSNGYETYASGSVKINEFGLFKMFTPDCNDMTIKQVRLLSGNTESELIKILKDHSFKEKISIEALHLSHGCYVTRISVTKGINL